MLLLKNSTLTSVNFDNAILHEAKFESVNMEVHQWKAIKKRIKKARLSFVNADLTGSHFIESKLDNSDFTGATFDNVKIGEQYKFGAKLSNCNFTNASFKKVFFNGVNLSNSIIDNCDFTNANFENTRVNGLNFTVAKLSGTSFANIKFDEKYDLSKVNFSTCNFRKVDFKKFTFEHTNFSQCHFSEVDIESSVFKYCNFNKATFLGCNMNKGNFSCSTFVESRFISGKLNRAKLTGCDLEGADLNKANLIGADIRSCNLSFANFRDAELTGIIYGRSNSKFEGLMLEGSLGNKRFIEFASNQGYLETLKKERPVVYYFWLITCDCGRSFALWMAWSVLVAILFGLKYYSLGENSFDLTNLPWSKSSLMYYSVVTFTTLGFGDILPKTVEAARWVMAEVVIGYIMLGGLISIFSSKISRRF